MPVMYVNRSTNQTKFRSLPQLRLATAVPVVGDNTVASRLLILAAGTSTLWMSTNATKDAELDCSWTFAGKLLLFTFTKNASIVVNFDISHLFTRLDHFELAQRHPGHGIVSSNESANG